MSMSKKAAMGKLITAERMVSFTANAQVTSTTANELVTTAIERVNATANDKRAAAATVEELIATIKMRVDPAREQVTTADGMDRSAAPIMGTTSAVLNDLMSSDSLGCRSTTTAYYMDAARLQQPLQD